MIRTDTSTPVPAARRLRVLVVDDSAEYRSVVAGIAAEVAGTEIVAMAPDGAAALEMIDAHRPDAVILDMEMPGIDGLEFLRRLRGRPVHPFVVILSDASDVAARATMEALHLGAFDFVIRPATRDAATREAALRRLLHPRLQGFLAVLGGTGGHSRRPAAPPHDPLRRRAPGVVAIGVSTGGPDALGRVLPALPASLPVPVLIVQHMPPIFTRTLADDLDRRCRVRVREAAEGDRVRPGEVLLAPGGRQMKVTGSPAQAIIRITNDPPEQNCRPAADYLFRSVAQVYGARALALVMTGMGSDGTIGARLIREHGGTVIVQDEATSVVFGMPRGPIEDGIAEAIIPLECIAAEIAGRVGAALAA
jgi:two-component system chemotaxis response regulator CheB